MITRPNRRRYRLNYCKPDPMRSLEDYERFVHEDLPGLSDFELSRELWIVKDRVYRSRCPDPWDCDRVTRLDAERRRRRTAS